MTPEELGDHIAQLWRYVLAQTEVITTLGERVTELERRSNEQ